MAAPSPSESDPSVLRPAAYWPWRLAVGSYACLALGLGLSLSGTYYADRLYFSLCVALSATALLGLTLLVTSALLAIRACIHRLNVIDFAVLLVTLPPIALHVWFLLRR